MRANKRAVQRRSGYERRVLTYDRYIPERRGQAPKDRRNGVERRKQ